MKKILLLVVPLIFIMSCDTDDDETSNGLVGTWTVESVTYYENGNCSGEGETDDFTNDSLTATVTYTEVLATFSLNMSQTLSSYCDDLGGTMVNDTTCIYDGDVELTSTAWATYCNEEESGTLDEDNNCNFVFTNEWYYTYHEDSSGYATYCEIYYDESESYNVETICGSVVVSDNSAMLQLIDENDDELECMIIMLSR